MNYIDLDESPNAEFLADLDDEELDAVLHEAIRAEIAAEEWSMAAMEEWVRRWRRPSPPPLHELLRVAERRRLERRRRKSRRSKRRT
jgi:predicted methyltransferase